METQNPATPANAAIPGNGAQNQSNPSAGTQPGNNQGQGGQSEGTVTISTKEYGELQRAKARSLSFEKRKGFYNSKNNPQNQEMNGDPNDPVSQEISRAQAGEAEAKRIAYKAEVTLKVRDLLDKEEFKSLPGSTRALILRNPAMLSEADNVEEALLDIEDFVRDQVITLGTQSTQQPVGNNGSRPENPTGHDTPPVISSGAPAPSAPADLEDTSKLTGTARSRATLRNSLRKQRMGIKE